MRGLIRSFLSGIPWSEKAEREEVLSLKPPPGRSIKIHNANGRTVVAGEDRDDVEITAVLHARGDSCEAAAELLDRIAIASRESGGSLVVEIEVPGRWTRRAFADLVVRVPRDLRTAVSAANGRICLSGLRGQVRARSSNGSVNAQDIVGDLEVYTSNAKVCCECTCGRLVARSSNGKIELGDHRGSVDASTSNGLIRVCLEELGQEGIVLATSNGRIVLDLPEKVDAEIDMRVDNGYIRNARELDSETGESNGHLRGRLGLGGIPIKLRTSNGTISLR